MRRIAGAESLVKASSEIIMDRSERLGPLGQRLGLDDLQRCE